MSIEQIKIMNNEMLKMRETLVREMECVERTSIKWYVARRALNSLWEAYGCLFELECMLAEEQK